MFVVLLFVIIINISHLEVTGMTVSVPYTTYLEVTGMTVSVPYTTYH